MWKDKHGVEIKNGDIVKSPQGGRIPIVFVEEWNDIAAELAIFLTPLDRDWESNGLYEIIGKEEPRTIPKENLGKMEDMPEYKRDYGKPPIDVIQQLFND